MDDAERRVSFFVLDRCRNHFLRLEVVSRVSRVTWRSVGIIHSTHRFLNSNCADSSILSQTSIQKLIEKLGVRLMPRGTGGHPVEPASKILAGLKVLSSGSFQQATADSMNYSQVSSNSSFSCLCRARETKSRVQFGRFLYSRFRFLRVRFSRLQPTEEISHV